MKKIRDRIFFGLKSVGRHVGQDSTALCSHFPVYEGLICEGVSLYANLSEYMFFIFHDKLQIFFLTLISRTKGNENKYLYIHTDMLKFIHAVDSMVTPIS